MARTNTTNRRPQRRKRATKFGFTRGRSSVPVRTPRPPVTRSRSGGIDDSVLAA